MKLFVCVLALIVAAAYGSPLAEFELDEPVEIQEVSELEMRSLISKRANQLQSDDFETEYERVFGPAKSCPSGWERKDIVYSNKDLVQCNVGNGANMLKGASSNPPTFNVAHGGSAKLCFDFGKQFKLRKISACCMGVATMRVRFCNDCSQTGCKGPTYNEEVSMKTMNTAFNGLIAGPDAWKDACRVILTVSNSMYTTACKGIAIQGCVKK